MVSVPDHLYERLDHEFGFTMSTSDFEGRPLSRNWKGIVFCHPPTGREIGRWVGKAYRQAREGATVICLLPSSTDTVWWHKYCMRAAEIRFLKGRLRFKGHQGTSPYGSVIVVFKPGDHTPRLTAMQGYAK